MHKTCNLILRKNKEIIKMYFGIEYADNDIW